MIYAVSIAAAVLALVGLIDQRARVLVGVVVYVWALTILADLAPDRLLAIALRPLVDLAGGILGLCVIASFRRYERWAVAAVGVFALMLLNHATFWLARYQGLDLWLPYAHALNALFILQLAILAGPGGKIGVGHARSWAGSILAGWRRRAGVGLGEVGSAHRSHGEVSDSGGDRGPYDRPNRPVHVSETGR